MPIRDSPDWLQTSSTNCVSAANQFDLQARIQRQNAAADWPTRRTEKPRSYPEMP
jgi:hypothetical protein